MAQTIRGAPIASDDPVSNELVVDMSDQMHKLQPDITQFTTILMELSKKEARREVIDWLDFRPFVARAA